MRFALIPFLITPCFAQVPLEDTTFADATSPTDLDLVVVRERAYGAGGIDLAAYDPNLFVEDFVQSIYVRTKHATSGTQLAVRGRLVFPPEITILGVIVDDNLLGGSADDGVLTASDLDFGVGLDPDLYSSSGRGLLLAFDDEHVCVRSNNTVDFHLYTRNLEVDDFRVLIDYGSSFPTDVAFDVQLITDSAAVRQVGETGIQVGEIAGPVLGNGVWLDAAGVDSIPLTSVGLPTQGVGFAFDPTGCIIDWRSTAATGVGDVLDFYDPINQVLIKNLRRSGTQDVEPGPYGRLYGRVLNFVGISVVDMLAGSVGLIEVTGLPAGVSGPERVCQGRTADEVFCASRGSLSAPFDYYTMDVRTGAMTGFWTTPAGTLPSSMKGCAVIGDTAYVIGQERDFLALNLTTGNFTAMEYTPPTSGGWFDMVVSPSGGELWFLRRNFLSSTGIDSYDIASGSFSTPMADFTEIGAAASMTLDAQGTLWVTRLGVGLSAAIDMVQVDPATWTVSGVVPCSGGLGNGGGRLAANVTPVRQDTPFCSQDANHSGNELSWMTSYGSLAVADNDFQLTAYSVRSNQFGYFLNGLGPGLLPFAGGADGNLCIAAGLGIGRHNAQIQNSGPNGVITIQVNLNDFPRPTATCRCCRATRTSSSAGTATVRAPRTTPTPSRSHSNREPSGAPRTACKLGSMEMPKPGPAHHVLERMAGDWVGTETMHPSPWDPKGSLADGRTQVRLALGGFAALVEYSQSREGVVSFEGHGVYEVDAATGDVLLHWFDSMGTGRDEFRGRFEGDLLTCTAHNRMGHWRSTNNYSNPNVLHTRMESSQDGESWTTLFEGEYHKRE